MEIPGAESCNGLIKSGWIINRDIWHVELVKSIGKYGDIITLWSLVMVDDMRSPSKDAVEIICYEPRFERLPTGFQISGLFIEYLDLRRTCGYEKNLWKVGDFEGGGMDVKCHDIQLRRVSKDDLWRPPYFTQQIYRHDIASVQP